MKSTDKLEMTTKEMNAGMRQFQELYRQGVDAWIEAGKVLVSLIDADPNVCEYLVKENPHITHSILAKFEQMGRGMLNPRLLLGGSLGESKLAKLPLSLQNRYVDEPVPLVVETATGTDILLVKVKDMTKDQTAQVFADGRIRAEGEQKAWLVDKRSKDARPVGGNVNAWRIKGNRVEFNAHVSLTLGEMLAITTQMAR